MKHLFICIVFLVALAMGFYSCDSTTSPDDPLSTSPSIASFEINPKAVEFTLEEDGPKDTTITLELYSLILNTTDEDNPRYSISEKSSGNIVAEGELTFLDSRRFNYSSEVTLQTETTSFSDFIVNVYFEENSQVYAQTIFKVEGFSNNPPEIIETDSPGVINRPTSGSVPATFTAKVTDADAQETIDKVYIRVISQESGEVQGSPFEMFDDGSTYNDDVASDSTYTWSLPVTPTENNPNRDFDIEFFALDLAGFSSDTVRTTFSIRE